MTQREVDLTPDPSLLIAASETSLTHKLALGEWIDNAFDANATRVEIDIGKSRVRKRGAEHIKVSDNGEGCSDLRVMCALGARHQHKRATLGRYGVGAKDAALWIGGTDSTLSIRSRRGDVINSIHVSWKEIIKAKSWHLPAENCESRPSDPHDSHGTTLTVSPIERSMPHGADWDRLLEEIGYMYAPAIKKGKTIEFRRAGRPPETVSRWEPPKLEPGVVDTEVEIDGKRVHIFVGIVQKGLPNPRAGITYWHGYRVIMKATGDGCGGRDYTRVCGFVELKDGWVLTKNKDNVSQDSERLYDAVYERCAHLLARAESQSHSLELEALTRSVADAVNLQAFGDPGGRPNAKAVRGDGDSSGSQEPRNRGRRHKKADRTQAGRTFGLNKAVTQYKISFNDFGTTDSVGRYDKNGTIMLNSFHPQVRYYQSHQSRVDLIAQLALGIIANAETVHEQLGLGVCDGQVDRFCRAFASLTMGSVRVDGATNGPQPLSACAE